MAFNPNIHHRRSIRLQGYDYSRAGAYFITICTQNRDCLFGNIIVGATPRGCPISTPRACPEMVLNHAGAMIQTVWDEIPFHYVGTEIDEFVVMPNHIHVIIVIGAGNTGTLSLGDIVHRFKTMTTKRYTDGVKQLGWPSFPGKLWQRNYWEHIVRDEMKLNRIRKYIHDNPTQWGLDRLNMKRGRSVNPPMIRERVVTYATEGWMV